MQSGMPASAVDCQSDALPHLRPNIAMLVKHDVPRAIIIATAVELHENMFLISTRGRLSLCISVQCDGLNGPTGIGWATHPNTHKPKHTHIHTHTNTHTLRHTHTPPAPSTTHTHTHNRPNTLITHK